MKSVSMKKKKHSKKNMGRAVLLPHWLVFPNHDYETDIDLGDDEFREYIMYVLRRGKVPGYFIPYNDN
ncbi:MAG: hypothetical protein QW561_03230 [Candidatus Aenigmatarchaeota archaeon]